MATSETLRHQAQKRAHRKCEYCLLHEEDAFVPHQPDHIIAENYGGMTTIENLAWSCSLCNRYKGPNISSIDPLTGKIMPLFNPRQQQWKRHFRLSGARIVPLTASGRATERLLRLNDRMRIEERLVLINAGRYPREP